MGTVFPNWTIITETNEIIYHSLSQSFNVHCAPYYFYSRPVSLKKRDMNDIPVTADWEVEAEGF